jgi:hypothetical protein
VFSKGYARKESPNFLDSWHGLCYYRGQDLRRRDGRMKTRRERREEKTRRNLAEAARTHEARREDCLNRLERIRLLLVDHGQGEQVNFGHVGDTQYVQSHLDEVEQFLAGFPNEN